MTDDVGAALFPSFVTGAAETKLRRELEDIAKALAARRAQLLFGAGMSAASHLPTGLKLATSLLARIYPEDSQPGTDAVQKLLCEFPLECVAEAVMGKGQKRIDIQEALKAELIDPGFAPNAGHEALRDICNMDPDKPYLQRIYTTNFDLLIERAFGYPNSGKAVRIHEANAHELRKEERAGKLPVVHLHGTLEDLHFVLTETDVEKPDSKMLGAFEEDLALDTFVLVGYGLRDPDIRRVYFRERQRITSRPEEDRNTYVVSRFKDDEEHAYILAERVWAARGAVLVPMDAATFMIQLKADLENRGFL